MEIIFITFIALLVGIIAGIIAGLIPGLHINTLAVVVLAFSTVLLKYFDAFSFAVFLIAMATTASFVNFIPSLFLGAPDPATALSVLPGHSLLNKGLGYRALKLTVIGGLGTFVVCLLILPLLFFTLKPVEPFLRSVLPFLLIAISVFFVARERKAQKIVWAAIVFLLAGVLGLLVLNHLNIEQGLFPMLAGLFGISTLFIAMQRRSIIPPQTTKTHIRFLKLGYVLNYLRAAASSLFVSVLPAVGAAQAAYLSKGFRRARDEEGFLMIVGGINTAAVIFTMSALLLLNRTRTGIMVALSEFMTLNTPSFFWLVLVAAVAAALGATASLLIGKSIALRLRSINYKKISLAVIGLVGLLVLLISSWLGLLVLAVATAIGMLAPLAGVRRIHAMACLIVPILMWTL